MWQRGARCTLAFCSLVFVACGAKTLDFNGPDGRAGNAGTTVGAGGTTGGAGAAGGSSGAAGAAGAGGAAGATGGGTGGTTVGAGGTTGGTGGATAGGTGGTTAGAGGATGGTGGTGGTTPGPYVTAVNANKVTKVDLLFMIDNSSSMADKQSILATAVPDFVDQLIQPKCLDPVTGRAVGNPVNGVCVVGELPFDPINDIHIGIISSSLGNHGAAGVCEDSLDTMLGRSDPHNNDGAHLLTRTVGGTVVPTYQSKGFLYYNPSVSGALATSAAVASPFKDMVIGVGQHGCGYEASLESAYRFLVEPEPYSTIRIDTSIGGFGQAILDGSDTTLLQQRVDFLRPDSLVSVMIITDENDCSIVDGGQGFYALLPPIAGTGHSVLQGGTSACATNPNDTCCFNCGQQSPPPGCAPAASDPACMSGELSVIDDQPNIRCFNQKRRYGVDFLYPVQRYVDGFTKATVPNRTGTLVQNPLFSDLTCQPGGICASPRDPSRVVVTGVVGVPWQDIAVDSSDLTKGFKSAQQLRDANTWADIVGDPSNKAGPVPPRDPHMIESIQPRAGLPGPGSAQRADAIHGHEWDPAKSSTAPNSDLQFACIFDLAPPKVCTTAEDCDCFGPDLPNVMNPLCQNAQGAYSTTQARAKAYPGTRILQVLQGLGDQGVVGSICPAQTTDTTRDDFGYAPALHGLVNQLRGPLNGCLPIALAVDPASQQTSCSIIEVFNDSGCNCESEPARKTAADALLTSEMKAKGNCRCEIQQLSGPAQTICRNNPNPPANSGDGWCYIDPARASESTCAMVSMCKADEKREIRFVNVNSAPRPGATPYLRCDSQPVTPLPSVCK